MSYPYETVLLPPILVDEALGGAKFVCNFSFSRERGQAQLAEKYKARNLPSSMKILANLMKLPPQERRITVYYQGRTVAKGTGTAVVDVSKLFFRQEAVIIRMPHPVPPQVKRRVQSESGLSLPYVMAMAWTPRAFQRYDLSDEGGLSFLRIVEAYGQPLLPRLPP